MAECGASTSFNERVANLTNGGRNGDVRLQLRESVLDAEDDDYLLGGRDNDLIFVFGDRLFCSDARDCVKR